MRPGILPGEGVSLEGVMRPKCVVPAEAGTQGTSVIATLINLDSRLRGNDVRYSLLPSAY
jgi:hypothetical protein